MIPLLADAAAFDGVPAEALKTWLLIAVGVVAIALMLRELLAKRPPDHQRWADRTETNRRLEILENHVEDIKEQAATDKTELLDRINQVPHETIALLKQTKGLIP